MHKPDHGLLEEILQARGGFGHREHLELAWRLLRLYSFDAAREVMVAAIQHVAHLHGTEGKYHETMTRVWLHLVAVHMQRWGADDFETFLELERNPDLLDGKLIRHFYSRDLILSEPARASWTSPDLRRLPALAPGVL